MEIEWLNLTDRVYLKSETIQYNFQILMNYLTNPFSQVLEMPDFRSSAAGLHHFAVVKNSASHIGDTAKFLFLC